MAKIFAIGAGPLLDKGVRFFSGQCLRTIHFVKPLLNAGHSIELCVHPISVVGFDPRPDPISTEAEFDGIRYRRFHSNDEASIVPFLQERLERFKPDALLGINSFPSHLACRLRTDRPIWCDLNGYGMVEGQTRAYRYDDDGCLAHFLRHEKSCLRRADKFSTVSTPQKFALLGELAMVGRLSKHTFDYDFTAVVPNAVAPRYLELGAGARSSDPAVFRALWCGGYNTWTDVDLLFGALDRAMSENPLIRFVSTGGAIDGHDEKTYARFQQLVARSPNHNRFDLRGWVETEVVDRLLMECDLGVNIDGRNNETIFGARNRVTTMLACGLPVLTTLGTEISHELRRRGLGYFVEIGDRDGLARAILYAVSHRDELRELGRRGREFACNEYACDKTLRPCLEWMASPSPAPDNARRLAVGDARKPLPLRPLNEIEAELAQLEETPLAELLRDRADLRAIRNRKLYRFAKAIKFWFLS